MNRLLRSNKQGDWFLGGKLLHPGNDPLSAARAELAGLLASAKPEDLIILAGCGLGWHAKALQEVKTPPQVVAYEPLDEVRQAWASQGTTLEDMDPAGDEESLLADLARRLVYGRVGRVAVFSPPAYKATRPDINQTARRILAETRTRGKVDHKTRVEKGSLWRDNLVENFKQVLDLPDPTLLANALGGVPALVVGAGPSLDESLAEISQASGRMLVVAAASALNPLKQVGMRPEVALALEGRDESRQFEGADHSRSILAAACSGHPAHFSQWTGPKAVFHLQPWVSAITGQGSFLPHGGHVGSAAFTLAVLWGCDPVVLVGQDLAYTGGRFHADGRPGGEAYDQPDMTPVPAIGGGEVPTSNEFISYRGWYSESAAYLKKADPARRVINATAAGARIPGFEHAPLGEVIKDLPPLGLGINSLRAALEGLPRPSRDSLGHRLALTRAEIKRGLHLLAEQGMGAVMAGLEAKSVTRQVLRGLPPNGTPDQAKELLEENLKTLSAMEAGLDD